MLTYVLLFFGVHSCARILATFGGLTSYPMPCSRQNPSIIWGICFQTLVAHCQTRATGNQHSLKKIMGKNEKICSRVAFFGLHSCGKTWATLEGVRSHPAPIKAKPLNDLQNMIWKPGRVVSAHSLWPPTLILISVRGVWHRTVS